MLEQLFCIFLAALIIVPFFYLLLYWRVPAQPTPPPPANESDVDSTYPILGIPLHMSERGQKELDEHMRSLDRRAEYGNRKWN